MILIFTYKFVLFFFYIIKWNNHKLNSIVPIKEHVLNEHAKIQVDRTLSSQNIMSTRLKNVNLRKMHLQFQLRFTIKKD